MRVSAAACGTVAALSLLSACGTSADIGGSGAAAPESMPQAGAPAGQSPGGGGGGGPVAGANGGQVAGATGVGSGGGGGGRTQAPPPVLNATPTNSFIVVTAGQSNAGLWFGSGFRDTYLPWVERVVQRFKDEPAVGMWELVKSASEVDAVTLRAFYAFIHASAGIDVASFQDYGAGGEEPPTLGETVEAMAALDKPFILSEAATFASPSGDPSQLYEGLPCISFAARRDLLASWFRTVFASGASGVEVWNYSPFSSDQCSSDISVGDPSVDLIRDFAIP